MPHVCMFLFAFVRSETGVSPCAKKRAYQCIGQEEEGAKDDRTDGLSHARAVWAVCIWVCVQVGVSVLPLCLNQALRLLACKCSFISVPWKIVCGEEREGKHRHTLTFTHTGQALHTPFTKLEGDGEGMHYHNSNKNKRGCMMSLGLMGRRKGASGFGSPSSSPLPSSWFVFGLKMKMCNRQFEDENV